MVDVITSKKGVPIDLKENPSWGLYQAAVTVPHSLLFNDVHGAVMTFVKLKVPRG